MKIEMTEEQKQRLKECKTPEDVKKFVTEEELELTDDELEAIAAGGTWLSPFPKPVTGEVGYCDHSY